MELDLNVDVFNIVIQPDPRKTLHREGTFQINERLNEEQVAGILLMTYNIFGDNYDQHIDLKRDNILYRPEYFFERHLIVATKQIIPYQEAQDDWITYIYRLAAQVGVFGRVPKPITKTYTIRFLNVQSNSSVIYQFETLNFIQGAISALQWFSLGSSSSSVVMDNLHTGNVSLQIR